ncbi:hypothetical protein FGO68_gene3722 [Halteria grandinella]|uniref:Uncharacterized protein n=1 Tax=Halteria grandinella TaxID=5974 RepID=A0A8J8P600_HALGN|nr:hypothetical protein FGO68_gene3722 [Halteria grandinella]
MIAQGCLQLNNQSIKINSLNYFHLHLSQTLYKASEPSFSFIPTIRSSGRQSCKLHAPKVTAVLSMSSEALIKDHIAS